VNLSPSSWTRDASGFTLGAETQVSVSDDTLAAGWLRRQTRFLIKKIAAGVHLGSPKTANRNLHEFVCGYGTDKGI